MTTDPIESEPPEETPADLVALPSEPKPLPKAYFDGPSGELGRLSVQPKIPVNSPVTSSSVESDAPRKSSPVDLGPSFEKIGRAERKFTGLEKMISDWKANGVRVAVRREVHGNRGHVIGRVEDLPPEDLAWEIVELVGHVRSALDKMVVALVEANGHGQSRAGFPFGGFDQDGNILPFPTKGHQKDIGNKLTPEQWKAVLDQKPYPGGNDLLRAVNELANEDKHRKDLVRVATSIKARSTTVSHGLFIVDGSGPAVAFGGDPDFACAEPERESVLTSYAYGPGCIHPQVEQSVAVAVVFGPIGPVSGKDVLDTLSQQIKLVRGIVEQFRDISS
jgi:hypothetical protein